MHNRCTNHAHGLQRSLFWLCVVCALVFFGTFLLTIYDYFYGTHLPFREGDVGRLQTRNLVGFAVFAALAVTLWFGRRKPT